MSRFRNPDEDEVQQYIRKAQAGQAGQSPRDQTLARSSSNPRAQRAGLQNMDARNRENLRNEADAIQEQERVAKEQAAAMKEQQAAMAEDQRKRSVREAAAAGVKVATDVESGKRDIVRHADGAPVWEAGPQGDPVIVGQSRTAIKDEATGQVTPVPDTSIMMGGGGDSGTISADGTTTQAVWKQQVRDDRGDSSYVDPESKTDAKTGAITYDKTNPTTGQKETVMMGRDLVAQEKAQRQAVIDEAENSLTLEEVQTKGARMRFDPAWTAADKKLQDAEAEMKKLPKNLMQDEGGNWYRLNPDTGMKYPFAKGDKFITDYQTQVKTAADNLKAAKAAHDPLAQQNKLIADKEREIDLRKQEIAEERAGLTAGLPKGYNHLQAALAKEMALLPATDGDVAAEEIGAASVPAPGVDPVPAPVPVTDLSPSGKRALGGMADLPGVSGEAWAAGTQTAFYRGNQRIAIMRPADGAQALFLNDENPVAKNDWDIVKAQASKPGSMPLYVRDNPNRVSAQAESRWVADSVNTLQQLAGDESAPLTQDQKGKLITDLGLQPDVIKQKVFNGEISVNTGEKLLKDLYNDTLEVVDPSDEAQFQAWVKATPERLQKWKESTEGVGFSFQKQNTMKQDYLAEWYALNKGKPGILRKDVLAMHAQDVGDKVGVLSHANLTSKAGAVGRAVRDDVAGSMVGQGLGALSTLGAAEAALFGVDGAKKELDEGMRLRNRDFASWANSSSRNIKAWSTPAGMKAKGTFDIAALRLQRTIDDAEDHPGDAVYRDLVVKAEESVRFAALAMHELSRDEEWPVTADNLDPNKDGALGRSLAMYKATADPRMFALYTERLLQGNGRRQYSEELEKKIGPQQAGFWGSVNHAMYAGWQELATEIATDAAMLVTGGAAKALQIGAKTARGASLAADGVKVGKAARIGQAVDKGLEALAAAGKFGTAQGTLQKPLTAMQKATNVGVQTVKGSVGEGLEEVVVEVGAENPNLVQAFGMGMLGSFGLAPAQIASSAIAREGVSDVSEQKRNTLLADSYNKRMASTPGFVPIDADTAGMARTMITPERNKIAADLRKMIANPKGSSPALQAMAKAVAQQMLTMIAVQDEITVSAAREIMQVTDPAQRAFVSGIAKVASGNTALLTRNELKAVRGAKTASGADYFAQVTMPDGRMVETITAEGRADMMDNHPSVGVLIQTDESSLLLQAQAEQQSTAAQQGTAAPAVQAAVAQEQNPAPQGQTNEQNQQGQPTGQAQAKAPNVALAGMDLALYESARASDPDMASPHAVVAAARAAGAPVSPSMADYVDNTPDPDASAAAPAQATAKDIAEQIKQRVESRVPAMKGRINVVEQSMNSGGSWVDFGDGSLNISIGDIEREIAARGGDTASTAQIIEEITARHEVIHIAQVEHVRREWEAAGKPGDFVSFYVQYYDSYASDILTPELEAAAANIYGKESWDAIETPAQKVSELVRMIVEAKLDPTKQEQFGELLRALQDEKSGRAKAGMVEIIRKAIDALLGTKLSTAAQEHVAKIEELYKELTTVKGQQTSQSAPQLAANQATPSPATGSQSDIPAANSGGMSIIRDGANSRILDAQGEEVANGTEAAMEAEWQSMQAEMTRPALVAGAALKAAYEKFPKLAGKNELADVAGDLIEQLENVAPEERAAFAEKALNDLVNALADRVAQDTGKDRMEVIEGFRTVAGKRQAAAAASVEAAIVGNSAPIIPAGPIETRDTPNSEMTIEVVQTALDLDQLVGSSDPRFPGAALQPRNRSGQASANQREEMVQNIRDKDGQYKRYVEGSTTDSGRLVVAPLFGADGAHMTNENGKPLFYVISGNGRRNALEEARNRKVDSRYQREVRESLSNDNTDVSAMAMPVPVSIYVPETPKQAIDLAEFSNRDAQLSVSNTEQANRDAASIEKDNLLRLWEPDQQGNAGAASNRDFVKAFSRAIGDEGILDSKGNLTDEGEQRIERAMVAMLLGPKESQLTEMLFNRSGALGLRGILSGIATEAGNLLKLAAEKPDFDLTPVLADALRTAVEAKAAVNSGTFASVAEFFDQGDMFNPTENTPERQLARALVESRTSKAIREILTSYRKGADAVDTSTMSMFAADETTREDLIVKALEARPIEQVIAEVEKEFSMSADLAAKLRIVAPGVKRMDAAQRREFAAAIGAEADRLRQGIINAPEYQRLNPGELTPTAALFQKFLDSHSAATVQAGFSKLLSKPVQAALKSSPSQPAENDIDSPASLGLDLQPYERPSEPSESASDFDKARFLALAAFERTAKQADGASETVSYFRVREGIQPGGILSTDRNDTLRRVFVSFVREFEQAFGKTVIFFDNGVSKPGGLSFRGSPNFIGININSPFSLPMLLGHELGHAIKRQDRNLYDAFQRDVLALAKGKESYGEMLTKRGYNEAQYADEIFNDIIGNLFARDSQMWQELATKDTTGALAKIATIAAGIINKMLAGLRKLNQRDTTALIEDELLAVRKSIADMLKLYRERGNMRRQNISDENATPDASPVFLRGNALFSSPTRSLDFGTSGDMGTKNQLGFNFDAVEKQITGPRAKQKANALDQMRKAPDKGKEILAKRVAKMEGLTDLDLFATAAVKSLDAEPSTNADLFTTKFDDSTKPEKVDNGKGLSDFGENLNVRKNRPSTFNADISDSDMTSQPFAKLWPKADVDSIESIPAAAIAHSLRESIPAKPRTDYKLRRWAEKLRSARAMMKMVETEGADYVLAQMGKLNSSLAAKARILMTLPRAQWSRIESVGNYPDAYMYEKDPDGGQSKMIPSPFADAVVDGSRIRATNITELAEKLQAMFAENSEAKAPGKPLKFEVRFDRKTYYINKKGDPLYSRLGEFETSKEAFAHIRNNYPALVAAWEGVKDRMNVKKTDVRNEENRPRVGQDWRNGKNATAAMFQEAFGFRGVAFGKWVDQGGNVKERQGVLNLAYDSLMDLAMSLGVPSRAMSLDGSLGLAFGADGSGQASATYNEGDVFINLTKTRGAGTLAHEFFHALDNYFQKKRPGKSRVPHGGNFMTYQPEAYYQHQKTGDRLSITRFNQIKQGGRFDNLDDWKRIEGVRPEVEERFAELVKVINASPMSKRAAAVDKGKVDGYWSRIIEKAARSFENYVIHRMMKEGYQNDYLANVKAASAFVRDAGLYPYLLPEEIKPVAVAFDNLFGAMETRETDRGVMLMSSPAPSENSDGQDVAEAVDSPYHVFGSTYIAVDESTAPQWAKDGIRAARKQAGYGRKVDIVRYSPQDGQGGSAIWSRLVGRGMSLFGKRILTVKTGDGKPLPFDAFVSTDNLNTIIIDVDSPTGLSYLYGHELGHSIQHQQPALYDKLKVEILAMAKDWKDYDARLAKVKEYDTQEKRDVEFVNDFIGSQFGEPEFWKQLRDRNQSVFLQLVNAALDFLNSLGSRIGKMHRDVRPYFADVDAARRVLIDILEAYQQGKFPDESQRKELGEVPDNELSSPSASSVEDAVVDTPADSITTVEEFRDAMMAPFTDEVIRAEQPKASYSDKRQLLFNFAASITDPAGEVPAKGAPGMLGDIPIIRQRLAREIAVNLKVEFLGDIVDTPEALAAKAQALRNPMFETFYVLAAKKTRKGVKIVDAMAITSRNPGSANIFADGKNWDEGIADHLEFLKNAKADSYFLLHNHPSGDPSPSRADLIITKKHAESMAENGIILADHIVINHKTFARIDAYGGIEISSISKSAATGENWPSAMMEHEIDGPLNLVEAAIQHQAQRGDSSNILGFFTGTKLKINASFTATIDELLKLTPEKVADYARTQGATSLFLHAIAKDEIAAGELLSKLKPLNAAQILRDVVVQYKAADGKMKHATGIDNLNYQSIGGFFGFEKSATGTRVQEEVIGDQVQFAAFGVNASKSFGDVRVGSMNALKAYRTLTAKKAKLGTLTAKEEQQLLDAETALGQKMAFDMDAVKAPSVQDAPTGLFAPRFGSNEAPAQQMEMSRAGEVDRSGQMVLLSSPTKNREATTIEEARNAASEFMNQPLTNADDGLTATVSQNALAKMLSASAVRKSSSPRSHMASVANLDNLFIEAIRTHSGPDEKADTNIAAMHRYYAPLLIDGELLLAKMTVKQFARESEGSRIYSVENLDIVKPAGNWVASISEERQNYTPQAGFEEKLLAKVEGINKNLAADEKEKSSEEAYIPAEATPTESEARALASFRPADAVRNRIIAQGNVGSNGLDGQGVGAVLKSSPTSDALRVSPTPSSARISELMAKIPPIYRAVYADLQAGLSPQEVATKNSIPVKGVANIMRRLESYLGSVTLAAADVLQPVTDGNGLIAGGRPDLAESGNPMVAAVDQLRDAAGIPEVRSHDVVNAAAAAMLAKDYQGAYDALLNRARDGGQMTDTEVAATKMIISNETMSGRIESMEDRMKLALLIYGYREIGTETARSLAMRRDPHQSPAERHAQYIAEALFTPDAETRRKMRKNPQSAEAMLQGWLKRVDGINRQLLMQGIDLKASLAAYNQEKIEQQEAENTNKQTAEVIKKEINKLNKFDKAIIQAIMKGGKDTRITKIAFLFGTPAAQVRELYLRFQGNLRESMKSAAKEYMASALRVAPSRDVMDDIMAELGLPSIDEIDDTAPDFEKRREAIQKERRKRKTPRRKTPAPATVPTPADPAAPTPSPTPAPAPKPKPPIDERTGTWDEDRDFQGQGELMRDPIDERTGTYNDARDFMGQKVMFRGDINELRGTFDLNDPLSVKAVMDAFALARGGEMDALMEFWRMSILTGPQTHVVNIGSNLLHGAYHLLPKRATEAVVNNLLGVVGLGSKDKATLGEFVPMMRNLKKGFALAARNALRSWKLEARTFEAYATAQPIQLDFTGVGSEYIPPALGGKFGKVMRSLSFRSMTAADEWIKSMYGQMEAAAQAHRIASNENLTGDAYAKRMDELMVPGSVAWVRAVSESKRITFQEDMDASNPRLIHRIDQLADLAKDARRMPYLGKPLTFFLPFIDTPTNIFKQAVLMSPMGTFISLVDGARALRRRVFSGDISKEEAKSRASELYDRARFVEDLTNQTIGWMIFFAIESLVGGEDDDELPYITGTVPYKTTARGERDNTYAVMPAQSIRIGGAQFSYSRIEPFATVLASMVDFSQSIKRNGYGSVATSEWLSRFKDAAKDKTFLQGISNLFNAIEDPDRFAERLTANVVTGFVPNIVRQPIRELDTNQRDTNPMADAGFWESVAVRVGYGIVPQAAPVKMDVWGNEVKSNRGEITGVQPVDMAMRIFDPTNMQFNAPVDEIDKWIFKWNRQTADSKDRISIMAIDDAIQGTVPGENRPRNFALTPEERAKANREAGQAARAMLGEGWDKMPLTSEHAQRIKDVVQQSQSYFRETLRNQKIGEAMK